MNNQSERKSRLAFPGMMNKGYEKPADKQQFTLDIRDADQNVKKEIYLQAPQYLKRHSSNFKQSQSSAFAAPSDKDHPS